MVASTCAQTCPEFRVIVVCHEIPEGNWTNQKLEILQVQHPAPARSDLEEMRRDRARKNLVGLNRALELSAGHVMFVDCDDCVSNRLAGFVAQNSQENGWYIRSGFFYSERQKYLHLERWRFAQWCGSGHIVRPEHLNFIERSDKGLRLYHTKLTARLRQHNTPIRPLPFPGAIYAVSHGDNFWDYEPILWPGNPLLHGIRRVLFHRPLTPGIRDEFGLYPVGAYS